MTRMLFSAFLAVALGYLALCAAVFLFQRSLIYFPQPRALGSGAGTMTLPVDEARVLVSIRPREGPRAVVYFGGNAEDVSFSLPDLAAAFPNHALYLLHYRGYGGSSGSPSETALFEDGLALLDKVLATHPQVVVIGRSLGSGVAVRVAGLRPVTRLVLVTPFDSLQDLAIAQFPYLPVKWLLRDKYQSWRYAAQVSAPTVLLAAEYDEVVPRSSTAKLFKRFAPGRATLEVLPGTSHNTISEHPRYHDLLKGLP